MTAAKQMLSKKQILLATALLISAVVSLWILIALPQFSDDAFITFRAARNLASGQGPYFNPGEAVQGTTTPIYVLLLAAGQKIIGLPTDVIEEYLEIPLVLAIAFFLYLIGRSHAVLRPIALCLPLFLFLQPYALTTSKGMEAFLYTALILAAISGEARSWRWWAVGLAIGLAASTRAEGGLLGISFFIYWLIGRIFFGGRDYPLKRLLSVAAAAIATGLPFLIYIYLEYHSLIPASVLAKVAQGRLGWPTFGEFFIRHLFGSFPLPEFWGIVLLPGIFLWARKKFWFNLQSYRALGFLLIQLILYAALFSAAKAPNYNWYLFPVKTMLIPFFVLSLIQIWNYGKLPANRSEADTSSPCPSGRGGGVREGFRWRFFRPLALLLFTYIAILSIATLAFVAQLTRGIDPGFPPQTGYPEIGKMLAEKTPSNWTFAAPEIGALGYIGNRRCLDLAGLVSPQCRPFFGKEPITRTVLRFRPEIFITPYIPEITPSDKDYIPALKQEFDSQYRQVAQHASATGYVWVFCRSDLAWPK